MIAGNRFRHPLIFLAGATVAVFLVMALVTMPRPCLRMPGQNGSLTRA